MRATPRAWLQRASLVAGSLFLAACLPITVPGGDTGPACPEGTYHVTDQVLSGVLPAFLGTIQLTPQPGGDLTLSVSASSWSFAGSQSFTVSGTTPYGAVSGTASVTVDAHGAWSKISSTELGFTLGAVSGSGSFTGSVGGYPYSRTVSLDELGIDDVYGFSGTATYACGAAPSLTLTFTSLHLDLDRD